MEQTVTKERKQDIIDALYGLLDQMKKDLELTKALLEECNPVVALDAKMTWLPTLKAALYDDDQYLVHPANLNRTIQMLQTFCDMPETSPEMNVGEFI